ncbi:MAG: folate-binding protein YgfZ [Proteobacteria bacterium]|uniref:CAF17-like 4Fe-4S cluster assembly/insertion protein YgfZ n=1 Tax=Rudaea sp. TaxID=2136325 RepID=UPI00321FCA34|nr:folate-binding protein YgfZ [Pseudomonadota bacterium]
MTALSRIALPPPQIVAIAGPDAVAFAQAQFSSNLAELANGHWQWSAWLSAQGRVRAFFHLLRDDDEHLRLVLRGGSATCLRDALARYVLRAKVTLRASEQAGAFVQRQAENDDGRAGSPQAKRIEYGSGTGAIILPGSPPRRLVLHDADGATIDADASEAARNENRVADIDAGLVTLAPALEDKLLPAWIGLDALGATSTNKGCYPGQEIVARLHFKGGNKRRLHRIAFEATQLPGPGASFGNEGGESGLIVCAAWSAPGTGAALAVLVDGTVDRLRGFISPAMTMRSIEVS